MKEWRWSKRRNAIEPVIVHMKNDNRMDRNYLRGTDGDKVNVILAACGFNLRKLLRAIFWLIFKDLIRCKLLQQGRKAHTWLWPLPFNKLTPMPTCLFCIH